VTTVARMLHLTAPFHRSVVLAVTLTFATVAANVALLATAAYLISKSAMVTEVATLTIAVTSVRLFAILRATGRYAERLVTHRMTFRVLAHLRAWFYAAIEPLAPARLSVHRSGDLLARSIADIETLEGFYVRVAVPPLAAILVAMVACGLLAVVNPNAAACLLAFLLLAGAVLPFATRRAAAAANAGLVRARAELNAVMVDHVQGVADLLVFDGARAHEARVEASGRELARMQRRAAVVRSATSALVMLLAWGAVVGVLVLGVRSVASGELGGVYLAALPMVALASFEAVQQLAAAAQGLDGSTEAGKRIFQLIDASPEVIEPAQPAPRPSDFSLEVRQLAFRYRPDERLVLNGLSFEVRPGETLAIVGGSGAGKSTIVALLVRFWDYDSGSIQVGGRELREYDGDTIRSFFAVAPQDVHLFNTTLRDNLLLADPDATDLQVDAACRVAQLGDLIASLPMGLDTPTGENGLQLSGGERQRLALARALLKDAPILILDEPTANLDADTEARLMAALAPSLVCRTALLISHRPAVWACADRVIFLEQGRTLDVSHSTGRQV
jgi:thiol reductant ABC exporter CydC subunit